MKKELEIIEGIIKQETVKNASLPFEAPHLPSEKRLMKRSPYRVINVQGRSIPVIHGRLGSNNHKQFNKANREVTDDLLNTLSKQFNNQRMA